MVYNKDAVERGETLQDGREKKSSKCGKQSKIQEKKVTLLTDKLAFKNIQLDCKYATVDLLRFSGELVSIEKIF